MAKDEKSKLALVKEAQAEQQSVIDDKREELLQALLDHHAIGGKDDLKASLLALVQKYPGGIQWPFVETLFPGALIAKVRDALKAEGKIEQLGKKGNVVLKPITTK